jgi:nitrogenase iron protein NifH
MLDKKPRQIAIYGKGSIGKSTIACNISIALSEMGHKVMQVGCSAKPDSTALLLGGELVTNDILSYSREVGVSEDSILHCIEEGYKGIMCAESGGPEPGAGCAGRGVALALDYLRKYDVYQQFDVDFVIYDAIADVVCGGFGQPMKAGYANEVYIVTSGELMSVYSANNICIAVTTVAEGGGAARVGGLIANLREVENEVVLLEEFSQMISVPIMGVIPRSDIVQRAEAEGGTALQIFPESDLAGLYRDLTNKLLDNKEARLPTPITLEEIKELGKKYQGM